MTAGHAPNKSLIFYSLNAKRACVTGKNASDATGYESATGTVDHSLFKMLFKK